MWTCVFTFSPQNRPVFPPESHAHGICTVCTWRVYMAYKKSPRKRKSLMSHAHACLGMSRHVHHACRGMSTHGRAWRGMESHGDACTCMETHAHAWRRMQTQGDACACRFSGEKQGDSGGEQKEDAWRRVSPCVSMRLHACACVSMHAHASPCDSMP